jgi:hypothetical protein
MKQTALLIMSVAAMTAVLSACGTNVTKSAATSTPAPPSTTKAAPSPTPSPSNSLSGPIGTTFRVTNGSNVVDVSLTKVIDPAQGADQYTTPDPGKRFVGAVFKLKGVTGSSSDDANSDASLLGSDGQTYSPDFNDIAGYTNFNSGEFNVSAGETSVGAVVFQVPSGVKVSKIEWSATGGFGGTPAEWQVP